MPQNKQKLLDTHIHLWPSTATTSRHHGWMNSPSHPLAKRQGIADYQHARQTPSPQTQPAAFVYVETDRYLPSPSPSISTSSASSSAGEEIQEEESSEAQRELAEWATEPLNELRFLRRMVEGRPESGGSDGFVAGDGDQMAGIVAWAPVHLPPWLFQLYLRLAEEVAGMETWRRVVGFRYLLQAIGNETELRRLVESEAWIENLVSLSRGRGGVGWSFDVGVDTRSGGVWQIEVIAEMVERVRKIEIERPGRGSTKFVLNHLCKPDLSTAGLSPSATRWSGAISRLAANPSVYMKFSGAFSEFGSRAPQAVAEVLNHLDYYASHAFQVFGPRRIMFGSDWPVCNVNGPNGEESWGAWRDVVDVYLSRQGIGEEGKEKVWWGTGIEAYGIKS